MTEYQVYTPHPSLTQPVTDEQRSRAAAWLQAAYADGKLSASQYDERVGRVWLAEDRAQLNSVFAGLIAQPAAAPVALRTAGASVPAVTSGAGERVASAMAHFLLIPTGPVGAGLIYAVSPRGSATKREAARAFNFQLFATILMMVSGMLFHHGALENLPGLIVVTSMIVSVITGLRILQGRSSKQLLIDATPLRPLKG